MADVVDSTVLHHRVDEWLRKVMINMVWNLFVMCSDAEGVERTPSEYGFAWYRTSDVMSITPKEKGQNGWTKLEAKCFLVKDFKDHPAG